MVEEETTKVVVMDLTQDWEGLVLGTNVKEKGINSSEHRERLWCSSELRKKNMNVIRSLMMIMSS